jgi:hypothetical protein
MSSGKMSAGDQPGWECMRNQTRESARKMETLTTLAVSWTERVWQASQGQAGRPRGGGGWCARERTFRFATTSKGVGKVDRSSAASRNCIGVLRRMWCVCVHVLAGEVPEMGELSRVQVQSVSTLLLSSRYCAAWHVPFDLDFWRRAGLRCAAHCGPDQGTGEKKQREPVSRRRRWQRGGLYDSRVSDQGSSM